MKLIQKLLAFLLVIFLSFGIGISDPAYAGNYFSRIDDGTQTAQSSK
jgi:hypothetical protein